MYVWKDEKILKKKQKQCKNYMFLCIHFKKPKAMYILYVIVYIICLSAFVEKNEKRQRSFFF